jgi:hypothetical protein
MLRALLLLQLALTLATVGKAQASQEFLFTFMNGSTRTFVLDQDWRPTVRQGQLVITPAVRVLMMDVALIRPFMPSEVTGLYQLKLMPQTPRVRNEGILVWLAIDPLKPGAYVDDDTGLVEAAPQTWVRPEAFRMAIQ